LIKVDRFLQKRRRAQVSDLFLQIGFIAATYNHDWNVLSFG